MAHAAKPSDLPTREGVSPSCVAMPAGPWPNCLAFLTERIPAVSAEEWRQRMLNGEVLDAEGRAVSPDAPCRPGLRLYYWRTLPFEVEIPGQIHIVFQDEHLVVADKPHFMPVTPKGRYVQQTLLVKLKRMTGVDTLTPMHRIDRETAGLVAFTVQPSERHAYQALFAERRVRKVYEAVAPFRPDRSWPMRYRSRLVPGDHFMAMHTVDGEPNAETQIELLDTQVAPGSDGQRWGRYRLSPITGRKHQLRAQMHALGLPLRHDRIYPTLWPESASTDFSRPLQLLARELAFDDPITGQSRHFHSQLALEWPPRP